ncbi:MAG: DUF3565 domain-containing protein [Acidimicrobiales bacterium]
MAEAFPTWRDWPVIRSIVGFHPDSHGDWVAELSCFHNQHVRHRPPLQPRPWVLDADGRAGRVGSPIDCPLCDRAELPDGLSLVGQAGPWDQDSLPAGLQGAHRTPGGRWGRLHIIEGEIDFQFESGITPVSPLHLKAGSAQPIPPGVPHRVAPTGPVRLQLEFWGRKT